METVHAPNGWYEDRREVCRTCEESACDDGFIPGEPRIPENICCECRECHRGWTPQEVREWMAEEQFEAEREEKPNDNNRLD